MATIGKQIAMYRARAELTQSGLARAVGTSQSAISPIEAGTRNPSYSMLYRIAKACNVTIDVLVTGTKPAARAATTTEGEQ